MTEIAEPPPPPAEKTMDQRRQEDFLRSLGLVSRSSLSQIQNKKSERKRRTTANPQFSAAAIEAKRITAQEAAARRARRREQIASGQIEDTRTLRANKARLPVFTKSKVTLSKAELKKDKLRLLASENNVNHGIVKHSKHINHYQHKQVNGGVKVSQTCCVCDEQCDTNLDVIMFCKDCQCLFHATCAATIDQIIDAGAVPCPKCDQKNQLQNEMKDYEMEEIKSPELPPPPPPAPSKSKRIKLENGHHHPKVSANQQVTLSKGHDGIGKKVDNKIHFRAKFLEQQQLVRDKIAHEKTWTECRTTMNALKTILMKKRQQNTALRAIHEATEAKINTIKAILDIIKKEQSTTAEDGDSNQNEPILPSTPQEVVVHAD